MVKSTVPKKQHWVPQLYLKAFATAESAGTKAPQVWCFRRGAGDPYTASIRDVAEKRFLYSPPTPDGTRSIDMEQNILNELETSLAAIWTELATGMLDLTHEQLRKAIALFVAVLFLRHPARIGDHAAIHAKLLAFFEEAPKDGGGVPDIDEFELDGIVCQFDKGSWERFRDQGDLDFQRLFVHGIRKQATRLAEIMLKKRWAVAISHDHDFATCDSPVIVEHTLRDRPFGFATAGAVVIVPISPSRMLIMDDTDQPNGEYYQWGRDAVVAANTTIWLNTKGVLISSRPTDDVLQEIMAAWDAAALD